MNLNTCYICKAKINKNAQIFRCCDQTVCSKNCSNCLLSKIKSFDTKLNHPSYWYTEKQSSKKLNIIYKENNIDETKKTTELIYNDYSFMKLDFYDITSIIRSFLPTIIVGIYSALTNRCCVE